MGPIARIFSHARIWTRILSACSHAYPKLKRFDDEAELLQSLLSQSLFLQEKRGKWWVRLLLIREKYNNIPKGKDRKALVKELTLKVGQEALTDVWLVGGPRRAVSERLERLGHVGDEDEGNGDEEDDEKSARYPIEEIQGVKLVKKGSKTGKSNWASSIVLDDEGGKEKVSVEDIALEHYIALGWKGVHCEGSIVSTIFGLLFWDIIFMDVPGAFKNAYQNCPMDYETALFYENRKPKIDELLDSIAAFDFTEIALVLGRKYNLHHEMMCAGVNWKLELADLVCVACGFGGKRLSDVCVVIAKYWKRRSGMPDLVLWKVPDGAAEQEYESSQQPPRVPIQLRLVEVKGPGDRLADHQKVWLDTFVKFGIDVAVCKVLDGTKRAKK